MDNQIQQLTDRVAKLEQDKIQAIMNNNADTNVVRSIQRILTVTPLAIGTSVPSACAILELFSTTLGLLLPRMTTGQRNALSNPLAGLVIYNSSTNKINVYTGSGWEAVTSS